MFAACAELLGVQADVVGKAEHLLERQTCLVETDRTSVSDAGLRAFLPLVALWVVPIGTLLALATATLRLARRGEPEGDDPP